MVESGLELDIEIYVNTGNETDDTEAKQLLETLDAEAALRRTLHIVNIKQAVMLTCMISGDEEMQALNKQHRQQDKTTDVLSFPLLDEPLVTASAEWLWQAPEEDGTNSDVARSSPPPFITPAELPTNLGDIVISWPTVKHQASSAGHPVGYELLFLLCHGVLHLVGYDDQTEAGYTEMVRLQKEVLAEMDREG